MQISKLTSVGMLCIIALGASAADFGGQMSVEYEYDRSGREVKAQIVNGEFLRKYFMICSANYKKITQKGLKIRKRVWEKP